MRTRCSSLITTAGVLAASAGVILFGSLWLPAAQAATKATTVTTASSSFGKILNTAQHGTLYIFAADTPGKSNCAGDCLKNWPAVLVKAGSLVKPAGVTATLGTLKRSDGSQQLTINRYPVYTFVGDSAPGATAGQGLNASGGLWWVVSPSGKTVMNAPSSSNTGGTSTPGTTNPSYNDQYVY